MKKIVAAGLLAMLALGLSGSRAEAWINSRICIGAGWQWQSGGNCFGWGLFHNGQAPAPTYGYSNFAPAYPSYAAPAWDYYGPPVLPSYAPAYSGPFMNYDAPYQYANYPQSSYYLPSSWNGR